MSHHTVILVMQPFSKLHMTMQVTLRKTRKLIGAVLEACTKVSCLDRVFNLGALLKSYAQEPGFLLVYGKVEDSSQPYPQGYLDRLHENWGE